MIWPLFKFLGQKFSNFFVGILVQTMTSKGHFEINWPLVHNKTYFSLLLTGLQLMCIVLFLCFDETRSERKLKNSGKRRTSKSWDALAAETFKLPKWQHPKKKWIITLGAYFDRFSWKKKIFWDIFTWRWKKNRKKK